MVCHDTGQLERFTAGGLDDGATAEVEAHVTRCPGCRRRLAEIEANLHVERGLRDAIAAEANGRPRSIGSFRVREVLGRGGMAVVYLAEQDHPRRRVAVKVLREDSVSDSIRLRFRHEADILAHLRHPGISQVFEAGVARVESAYGVAEQPYLAMEYIEGEPIDAYAARLALPARQRLELIAVVCDAIHHAHLRGVIHRDLKPANVLVETATRRPKIVDFGIARAADPELGTAGLRTEIGHLVGTIPFMSPEQIAGDPASIDARSDVYALGVIAFQVLTGELPHPVRDRSLVEAARIIREDRPRRLGALDARLRGDVETIVDKALATEPERRYQSAAEMASDLRRFLAGEAIAARPPRALEQIARFARRNRTLAGAALAAVFALVLGLGVALWQAGAARDAERRAEEQLTDAVRRSSDLINRVAVRLAENPQTRAAAILVVEDVRSFFAGIAPRHPDDLAIQQGYWESLRLLSDLVAYQGDPERALAIMEQSHALVRRGVELFPDDPEVGFQHGYSLLNMATAISFNDPEASERFAREAADVLAAVIARFDALPAHHHHQFANALTTVAAHERDPERRLARVREAVEQGVIACERAPDNRAFRTALAHGYASLASQLFGRGDVEGAIASLRRAVDLLDAGTPLRAALEERLGRYEASRAGTTGEPASETPVGEAVTTEPGGDAARAATPSGR